MNDRNRLEASFIRVQEMMLESTKLNQQMFDLFTRNFERFAERMTRIELAVFGVSED